MNPSPTFGLLVPCKNGAKFLPRLFASVRAQTRPFDEIWLFDDGSDDNTSAVAAELGAKIMRVEKSLGPSGARNRLTAACACEWLHFHDADDTMAPRYLEQVAARVQSKIDVVICDMLWLREETGQVENRWTYDPAAFARDAVSYLLINTVGGINGLYRRSALVSIGGFNEALCYWEDLDLSLRLSQSGARTEVVNEYLVTAYRRDSSYSNSNLGEVWRVKLQIMEGLYGSADRALLATIATEAEIIADRLALLNLWGDVPAALTLARQAGGNPPTTRNPILRALKIIFPATWTFRIQHARRKNPAP